MHPTQPKTALQPVKTERAHRSERRDPTEKPVGQPIDPALLKQIGGGNNLPVGRW